MRILITGGFGYLGSTCAQYLKAKGNEITIIGRYVPIYMKEWAENFNIIIADIVDEKLFLQIVNEEYDCAIHFAAANEVKCRKEPKKSILINSYGTANFLEACLQANIKRFIYISTFHVYAKDNSNKFINEESAIEANDLYGLTHYFSENIIKYYTTNRDLIASVIRASNFYSKPLFKEIDRWSLVPNNFIRQAYESNKIIINSSGNQVRNFLSIDDLANAIEIIINKQSLKFDTFNVGGEKNYSINELAELVKNIGEQMIDGRSIKIIRSEDHDTIKKTESIFDISKVKSIGYKSSGNIENEIRKTFNQLLEEGVRDEGKNNSY